MHEVSKEQNNTFEFSVEKVQILKFQIFVLGFYFRLYLESEQYLNKGT